MRLTLLASALALWGCASVGTGQRASNQLDADSELHDEAVVDYSQPVPQIPVLQQSSALGCKTRVLGIVDVHAEMSRNEGALDELRRRADAMGADALVSVGFRHGDDEGEPMHLSGMAVRCEDMLRGRAFDIVGHVEVAAPMGDEAEGLLALRRRARDLGADLIIHVRFDHGRGEGEPTLVSGDAIRFRAVPTPGGGAAMPVATSAGPTP